MTEDCYACVCRRVGAPAQAVSDQGVPGTQVELHCHRLFSPTSENLIVSAVLFSFFKVIMFYLFYVSMRGTCACHIMHVEVRGQLACECSLHLMGSGGLSLVTRLGRRCLCREPMTGIMCSGDF